MWEEGKGQLCVGGGKGSAVCWRREGISCVLEVGRDQLCVGGGKRSSVYGRRKNLICMRGEGMWEDERKGLALSGRKERVFWEWEEGSVCCIWEDGRGLLSVGTWKGSSGCGRWEVSAVFGRMEEGAC